MDLKVDIEGGSIFLEGRSFLVRLSAEEAQHLAGSLEQAALKLRHSDPQPDNDES